MKKLFLAILVVGLIGCDKNKEPNQSENIQSTNQAQQNEQLNQITHSESNKEIANNSPKFNTVTSSSISVEQTKEFIQRVENTLAKDKTIDLDNIQKVTEQSRSYNALIDEAEHIYGKPNVTNPYNSCLIYTLTARDLWTVKWQRNIENAKNEDLRKSFVHSNERNKMALITSKKDCLEEVESPET